MSNSQAVSSITQIPGVYAAHSTNTEAGTGCTVIICPDGATGAVDVRGGAPATRETDLLRPEETVQAVQAVVLSGGSAFGLAASCGVAEELERHGVGFDVGVTHVPIVNSACLFDLGCGRSDVRPTADDGAQAAAQALARWHGQADTAGSPDWNSIADAGDTAANNAAERQAKAAEARANEGTSRPSATGSSTESSAKRPSDPIASPVEGPDHPLDTRESEEVAALPAPLPRGNVGAGTGCTVGKVLGPERTMKSGLGEHVEQVGSLLVGAVAAVNAAGDVVDPDSGAPVAGLLSSDGTKVASTLAALRTLAEQAQAENSTGGSLEEECPSGSRAEGSEASGSAPGPAASDMDAGTAPRTNTTISCVVTNARLTKAQATKVAQMSADAYAHAIRPTHTTNDGDTIFVLATNRVDVSTDLVGITATRALELAIVDAARSATTAYGYKAARDL